ncbi:MAG: type II toxin-antitoxin system RelB/DinJ family antitoxin [Actinomycetaceae bacterium]|nr:type II toxin-antitoxin system RelB/DinJ family antitoxin [Actinomycetaceae bacterium]
MTTVPTQIRIDATVKEQASELFSGLGLDMSSAVNIFLRQCLMNQGLPFAVAMPRYNQETLQALEEGERLLYDDTAPSYSSMDELKKALLA